MLRIRRPARGGARRLIRHSDRNPIFLFVAAGAAMSALRRSGSRDLQEILPNRRVEMAASIGMGAGDARG